MYLSMILTTLLATFSTAPLNLALPKPALTAHPSTAFVALDFQLPFVKSMTPVGASNSARGCDQRI
jgi:hypothetical protein